MILTARLGGGRHASQTIEVELCNWGEDAHRWRCPKGCPDGVVAHHITHCGPMDGGNRLERPYTLYECRWCDEVWRGPSRRE